MSQLTHCRWSPTLGELEDTALNVWGTPDYDPEKHADEPTVFFGCYGLPDVMVIRAHKGKRYILWAGSDATHLLEGYWLDEVGKYRLDPYQIGAWLNVAAENYCENITEQQALKSVGIEARIVPSFLGDVEKFKIEYQPSAWPKVYLSVSGDEFIKYGWDDVERIAGKCKTDFYLYGNVGEWKTRHGNVHIRGRIPKEEMNAEIKSMQCGLRPLAFDGISEIVVKGGLMGHYVISKVPYPNAWTYDNDEELIELLNSLSSKVEPNTVFRDWLINNLNQFPFNTKKHEI